jgi:uncharacterized protein YndB with AHSA1/START domain
MPNTDGRTVEIHRVLKAPAARVYKAFVDADALARWLPPYGFTGKVHEMDAKVGSGYKMSFTNFSSGSSHSFSAVYTELKPNERIVHKDKFDTEFLPGEMTVTIVLKEVSCGTELSITQENIPAPIPVDSCYLGWQESLMQLAKLVEPEIPG